MSFYCSDFLRVFSWDVIVASLWSIRLGFGIFSWLHEFQLSLKALYLRIKVWISYEAWDENAWTVSMRFILLFQQPFPMYILTWMYWCHLIIVHFEVSCLIPLHLIISFLVILKFFCDWDTVQRSYSKFCEERHPWIINFPLPKCFVSFQILMRKFLHLLCSLLLAPLYLCGHGLPTILLPHLYWWSNC